MTLHSIAALSEAGLVRDRDRTALDAVARRYAVSITPHLAELIDRADPHDPIAAQFVPHPDELVVTPDERADPIGDAAHSPVPGIVHRYPDRVLLKLLHVCPVYCRFCFRRETVGPGEDAVLSPAATAGALRYIAETQAIWEVIFTGGDPLILSPRRLADVMDRLSGIEHVKVIRFHTRVPVADPDRVTAELVAVLKRADKAVFVALHANHPRELGPETRRACARLIDAGIPMVSQTVLLRGINDDPATLEALMRGFVESRIKPYYLHHGDLAPGTGHFRTGVAEGRSLVHGLRGHVSGLCQPTYVLDIPGGYGKVDLGRAEVALDAGDGSCTVCDRHGRSHRVPGAAGIACG